jgi:phospholipid N-methyltransferase
MKKMLLFFTVAASFAACKKNDDLVAPNVPVTNKTIHFVLSQAKDYSGPQYNGVQAEVRLSISRISLVGGTNRTVWDSVISFQSLREFPLAQSPVVISKEVRQVNDGRESVQASYFIRYRTANNEQTARGKNDFVASGNQSLSMTVGL